MKKSFIVDLDVESDTDFLGIAEELKDSINSHFPLACLRVAPWASPSLGQTTPMQIQAPIPPPTL